MEVTPKFDSDSKSDSDEDDNIKQFGPTSTKILAPTKQHVDDIGISVKPLFDIVEVTSGHDHMADTTIALYHEYLFPEILEFQNIDNGHLLGMTKHISTEHMIGYKENMGMLGSDNNG
ncbi:hypothetical protein NC651_018317 [Populus alba x Populus x berolinensis]|nr:hypothetical protein NC651_018317 [Populus alba x Populus x berolinensis]